MVHTFSIVLHRVIWMWTLHTTPHVYTKYIKISIYRLQGIYGIWITSQSCLRNTWILDFSSIRLWLKLPARIVKFAHTGRGVTFLIGMVPMLVTVGLAAVTWPQTTRISTWESPNAFFGILCSCKMLQISGYLRWFTQFHQWWKLKHVSTLQFPSIWIHGMERPLRCV